MSEQNYAQDQQVRILYGKWQGLTGTVVRVSKGVGYWYLVKIDNHGEPQWIHRLHLRGMAA